MSIYLDSFTFPNSEEEYSFFYRATHPMYNNLYPAKILTNRLRKIEFAPVTILYGGNGSGKSTALNLMAEKLRIQRTTPYNKAPFFESYAQKLCEEHVQNIPMQMRIITSDDVFKNIFFTRQRNEKIDRERENLFKERQQLANTEFKYYKEGKNLLNHYKEIHDMNEAKSSTASNFVYNRAEKNIIGKSNGETALDYFMNELKDEGLYLLDEPENSLSAIYQMELANFLWNSARFFSCQLVIATHSPFILAIPGAKIYNLDCERAEETEDWTSLENMKVYYEFFKRFQKQFE